MLKYADLLEQHAAEVASLESRCMGAPTFLARGLVDSQVASFRYYAGLVDKMPGENYPEDGDGLFKMIHYEPLGVCAGIAAWNATQLFAGWKVSDHLFLYSYYQEEVHWTVQQGSKISRSLPIQALY